jgi:2'-5' RNA ligase
MRAFIGIEIASDAEIEKVLAEMKRLGLRTVAKENLHINIKFLGEVSEEQAGGIKNVLDSAAGFGGFEIELKDIGAFPDSSFIRVVWIGVKSDKVTALAKMLEDGLERLGFNKETSYIPHITLARVAKRVEGLNRLLGEKDFGRQKIGEVHLIKSTLGPSGPIYEKIHSVKL